MRTNSIYAPYRAVQKTWTIQNRYGHTYAKICIFRTVSPSNRRRLNSVMSYTNMKLNEVLFASSSPRARRWPRRCRACRCGRLEDGVHNSLSCQNRYKMVSIENFSTISPHKTEVFKPCKKSINALAHLWDVEPQRGGKASVERWSTAAERQCGANLNKHSTLTFSEQRQIDPLLVSNSSQAIHSLTVDKTQCVAPDISN